MSCDDKLTSEYVWRTIINNYLLLPIVPPTITNIDPKRAGKNDEIESPKRAMSRSSKRP